MNGGPQLRVSSPSPGRSIFITSAPKSANIWLAQGPARTRDRSRTRMWLSGPVIVFSFLMPMLLSRRRWRGNHTLGVMQFSVGPALGNVWLRWLLPLPVVIETSYYLGTYPESG